MSNDFNIPVVSMNYEMFMKKCIGTSPKIRHLWSSDNMVLLLSYSESHNNNSYQFEKVQDNLLYAVDVILRNSGRNDKSQLFVLKDKLNHASDINSLTECLDYGLSIIDKYQI